MHAILIQTHGLAENATRPVSAKRWKTYYKLSLLAAVMVGVAYTAVALPNPSDPFTFGNEAAHEQTDAAVNHALKHGKPRNTAPLDPVLTPGHQSSGVHDDYENVERKVADDASVIRKPRHANHALVNHRRYITRPGR